MHVSSKRVVVDMDVHSTGICATSLPEKNATIGVPGEHVPVDLEAFDRSSKINL
jgi:hypothetical protein